MAAQLDYGWDTPKGVPGQKADLADSEVISRKNEEADGVLKFGMAVQVGTTPGVSVKKPASGATASQIEGVVLAREHTEQDMHGNVVVQEGATVSVLKRGNVWARLASSVTEAPAYGTTAYVVVSGDDAGCFAATAGGTVDVGAVFGAWSDLDHGIAVIALA